MGWGGPSQKDAKSNGKVKESRDLGGPRKGRGGEGAGRCLLGGALPSLFPKPSSCYNSGPTDRDHEITHRARLGGLLGQPPPQASRRSEQGPLEREELAVRRQEAAGDAQSCLCVTVLRTVAWVPWRTTRRGHTGRDLSQAGSQRERWRGGGEAETSWGAPCSAKHTARVNLKHEPAEKTAKRNQRLGRKRRAA